MEENILWSLSLLKANNYAYARMKNPGWPGKEISKQKMRGYDWYCYYPTKCVVLIIYNVIALFLNDLATRSKI
jgi:hypothetical protein